MFAELLERSVSMTDDELDEALRRTEFEVRDLAARRAALVAVARHRRLYAIDGHRSMPAYLRATVNSGGGDIARDQKLARLVDRLPAVGEALMAGHISIAHALELDRVSGNPRIGHVLDVVGSVLIEVAEHCSYDEFRDRITEFVNLVDVDGAFADLASGVEHRNARVSDVDGTLDVVAVGGHPLTAARVAAIFQGFVEAEFQRDVAARISDHGDDADQHPLPRTAGQRRFDAMISIFDAAAGSAEGAAAPIPTVHVLVDDQTLDDTFARVGITLPNGSVVDGDEFVGDDDTMLDTLVDELQSDPEAFLSRRCETSSGSKIHPIVALQAALTGHIRRVVVDSTGTVIDYGTQQRLFTGNARAAALLLARWCAHPGCRLAASLCEVDHNDEWHAGGHTDQANSNVECKSHNRFKHRRRWTTRRDACGRVYTLRDDGTIVLPVGEREPDLSIDEMARAARARLASLCAQLDR
jgi:hypothetical protein